MNYCYLLQQTTAWLIVLVTVQGQEVVKWATDDRGHDGLEGQLTQSFGSVDECVSACASKGTSSCTAAGFLKSGGSVKCGFFPGGSDAVKKLRKCATVSRNNAMPEGKVALAYCWQKTDATGKTESATSGFNDGECFKRNILGKCALFALIDCNTGSSKEYFVTYLDCLRYAPDDPVDGDEDTPFLDNNAVGFGGDASDRSVDSVNRRFKPSVTKKGSSGPTCRLQGPDSGTIILIGGVAPNSPNIEAYTVNTDLPHSPIANVFSLPSLAALILPVHAGWLTGTTLFLTNEQSGASFLIDSTDLSTQPVPGPVSSRVRSFGIAACGRYILCGGRESTGTNSLHSCEIFDPSQDAWNAGDLMLDAREAASLVALGNSILVIGGWNGFTNNHTGSVEIMDNVKDVFQERPQWRRHPFSLLQRRSEHASVVVGDSFIVTCGGRSDEVQFGVLRSCEVLVNLNKSWTSNFPSMNEPRAGFSLVVEGSRIYAMGGYRMGFDGSFIVLHSVEFIDLTSDSDGWQYEPALFHGRFNHAAILV